MLKASLGSTTLTTDESGNVVARQRYSPYGEVRSAGGDLPTDFTFTGQRGGAAFGLLDYHARWYSARLGRFVSADTIAPGAGSLALNRYMYVKGNPVRFTDPDGRCMPGEPGCPSRMTRSSFDTPLADPWEMSIPEAQARLYEEAEQAFVAEMGMPIAQFVPDFATEASSFGGKNTFGGLGYHAAVDILPSNKNPHPPVYAVAPGTVVEIETRAKVDFGRRVVIQHSVRGFRFYSIYCHLNTVDVSAGDEVRRSTQIGTMGNTGNVPPGQSKMGVHLHFEVRKALYVNVDERGNYLSMVATRDSYWADSYDELVRGWVDLGPRFGYAQDYPWPRRPLFD